MFSNNKDDQDCCVRLGRPKDKHKQAAILEAAATLIVEKGFASTSMDAVAKMAGVSKQTVYSHFNNKETLFKNAVAYYSCNVLAFDSITSCEHSTVEGELTMFATAFVNLTMSAPSMAVNKLIVGPSKNAKKLAKIFYDAGPMVCKKNLTQLLEVWIKKDELKIDDTDLAVAQLISMLLGEDHYLTTIGLKTTFSEKEKTKHVKNSVSAFLKIYS
jgi:TetR/AcrR family transcriptional repressor of mexJK operon